MSFLEGAPEGLRRWAQGEIAAAHDAYAALSAPASARKARRTSPPRRIAVGIATLAVSVGVVVGVYNIGGDQSETAPKSAGTAATPSLSPGDEVRVSQLMRKLETNPKDAAVLVQIGDIFFKAGDYNSAGGWMERAVATEPENVKARLALGAAKFNLGDAADAQREWQRVIAADPENVEAYYDLGFLYLSKDPPDMTKAKKMWRRVVEIAPGSSVAKTVATHLKGLKEQSSTAAAPAREAG